MTQQAERMDGEVIATLVGIAGRLEVYTDLGDRYPDLHYSVRMEIGRFIKLRLHFPVRTRALRDFAARLSIALAGEE